MVAHDLRTPLNFIKMATEIIADDPGGQESREIVGRIDGAADLMNLLIAESIPRTDIITGSLLQCVATSCACMITCG